MNRRINFAPGPATLPLPVLKTIQEELLDYHGSGISMLEHSHRGDVYMEMHTNIKKLLQKLLNLTSEHEVFFMQGGARTHFALLPMNMLHENQIAEYVNTGTWSDKAFKEALYFGKAEEIISSKKNNGYVSVPSISEIEEKSSDAAAYLHLTTNNTVMGTQYHSLPHIKAPLALDMSSDILSISRDMSSIDFAYAGAQKNLGIPGIVILIAKKDFIKKGKKDLPEILSYQKIIEKDSLANTIPTFTMHVLHEMLLWLDQKGGIDNIEKENIKKSDLIYNEIDNRPDFYLSQIEKNSRSRINIVFTLPSKEKEDEFIKLAKENNFVNIKGHRSVGGFRISLYNAMELEHVERFANFMHQFN